jgi:hypothetical protein
MAKPLFGVTLNAVVPPAFTVALEGETLPPVPALALTP